MKPVVSVAGEIQNIKRSVADLYNKNGWRPAVHQRFNFVPRDGCLVVESVLEGIWSVDFREWVVTEVRFREISGDPDLEYDLMEEILPITTARKKERRILPHERMWSGGSRGGYGDETGSNYGHEGGADRTSGALTHGCNDGPNARSHGGGHVDGDDIDEDAEGDEGDNCNRAPGSGEGGSGARTAIEPLVVVMVGMAPFRRRGQRRFQPWWRRRRRVGGQ